MLTIDPRALRTRFATLETAKRSLTLLSHADESGTDGSRDTCINLAVFYQQAAREIEQYVQGCQASTSGSGPIEDSIGGKGGVAA